MLRSWLLLLAAVAAEVTGSLSLKAALTHPSWYLVVAAGYLTSFVMLALVLRSGMALGVAYGIWGALGVASTALLAAALFDEPLTVTMLVGLAVIIAGVLCVEMGAQRAREREATP